MGWDGVAYARTPCFFRLLKGLHGPVHFESTLLDDPTIPTKSPLCGIVMELWRHEGSAPVVALFVAMIAVGATGVLWVSSGISALVALSPLWAFTPICWTALVLVSCTKTEAVSIVVCLVCFGLPISFLVCCALAIDGILPTDTIAAWALIFIPLWFACAITLFMVIFIAAVAQIGECPLMRVAFVCAQFIPVAGIVGLCIRLGGGGEWMPYVALFGVIVIGVVTNYLVVPLLLIEALEPMRDG